MFQQRVRPIVIRIVGLALALTSLSYLFNLDQHTGASRIVLWAWERPTNLREIDTTHVSVAYLAATLDISGSDLRVTPRRQPLLLATGTRTIPVIRMEIATNSQASSLPLISIRDCIKKEFVRCNATSIQIDFDARVSERPFYRALLQELRAELPRGTRIAITALASWCIYDTWIDSLPINEAIPMFFRMGSDDKRVKDYINSGGRVRSTMAARNVGIALDEPIHPDLRGRTVYVFNSAPWTPKSIHKVEMMLGGF